MRDRTRTILNGIALLLLAIILWSLLVAAGVHGVFRDLFHPRVYSRGLASAIFLVVLAGWRLWVVCRSPVADNSSFRALVPFLLLLVLVPPAIRPPRTDYSRLNLTAVEEVLEGTPETTPDTARTATEDLEELLARPDPIVITDEEYSHIVDLIWESPERLSGRTIEVVSFVFRRPEWPDEIFTAARLSIWCCVVDAAVIGLLVEPGSHHRPREGEWIRIRGELAVRDAFDTGTITMNRVPVLRNTTWETVAAPSFEYVFPADW